MLPLPRGAVWQLLFLLCAVLYINGVRADGRVVCYYTNWSVYRPGTAKFNPQNINPYLCTHLIYAFGGFTKDNQMKPFDKYQDIEQGGYAKFTGLKTYNKQLKTMIAIGGWNEASSRFSPLVANPERRQKFIKNILKFLRQNHFDGIDLDWEYPAHREGGKPRDRDNYAQFVQELRAEFERESEKTGRPRLLLTMAVPAGIEYIEKGYDIPKLNKYLDWFNLLTYDFHSSHEPSVNHHAPLYSLEEESEYNYDAELNIDYSVKFYLNAGADRDKLVLGIPTYGRSYTLINEESTEIGAPAEAPGEQGDATREKGYLAYYEICQNIKEDPEWTVVQPNPNAMGPYAYRRNQWVGYDDEAIVRKKAQYVVENGLGGIMFWAIDNDDFRGTCTGKPYPLIEAAKEAMLDALGLGINEVSKPSAPQKPSRSRSRENSSSTRNRITTTEHKLTYAERKGSSKRTQVAQQTTRRQQPSTTSAPTTIKLTEAEGSSLYIGGRTTTPPPPTTPDPGTDFKCEEEGFFQHPRDCKKYYWCLDSGPSGLGIVAHMFTCPSGLYFNPAADSCDFARNVPCKTKKSTTAAPVTSTTTTTARPTSSYNRVTAATSRATTFFRTTPRTTTTTTTEAPEEDFEYEEEDDHAPSPFAKPKGFDKDSEEDPKVIKELIELIRKVGGIEELEKHLLRKDDGTISIKESSSSSSSSSITATTPSTISKSLYEKVLSKPNALNSFRNRFTSTSSFRTTKTQIKTQDNTETESEETREADSKSSGASAGYNKYSSVLRGNSRQGPQSEGIDKLSEFDGFLKEKKQYITINRNRGVKKTSTDEDDEEKEEVASKSSTESNEDEIEEEEKVSVKSTRRPLGASTPAYSTIRRTRPSTTTEATQEEEQEEKEVTERKSYSTLNRSRVRGTTTTELPDATEVTAGTSRYKYLERTRPTRPSTQSTNKAADEEDDDDDIESENQENTVHFKAVNIENTRETQQEITTNTQRTYASIGRRTTTTSSTPTATPETETTTSAAKTTTTTTATPTTSTTETPLTTTPLTILESTTPESILTTTNIPITTTTNPTTISSSSPIGEDVLESLASTTPNTNEISSDISEKSNSLLTDSSSSSSSTPSPTTESGLDTNEQESDSQLTTTTETTLSSTTTAINDSDNLTKTEDTEQQQQEVEEVNVVSKQRNKTLYSTRTRTTTTTTPTTTTPPPPTKTTETTSSSSTNAKKTLGVRRQQILLNRSSQTKTTSTVTTTDTPITTSTTESVNNDFLGTVSSPRPFGFPKRRNRPTSSSGATTTTTTEETVKPNDETLVTKQKTTKLNAAANSQIKVSSQNTILSQTASVHEAETSSQQEHILQEESEVTSTEHLNSKVDTKVEHLNKHVLVDVDDDDGIEGNNVNSLRHVNNLVNSNNNVDSSSSISNNNNITTKTITRTIVHEVDDDDEDPKKLFTWRDPRQPTKPTPKKKKLVVTEITTEERIRQQVSPDHVTIVNELESSEKDSRFSKKQDEVSKETGKYRGKSLEESVENVNVEENHVDGEEEEGRAFRTYTTINRRRQQTTGIGNDINTAVKTDEEEHENNLKTKVKYQTITRGQTTKTVSEEINENGLKSSVNRGSSKEEISTEDGDDKQIKTRFQYTEITRGHQGSQEDHEANENSQESEDNLKTKFKYTTITRGSNSKTVSESDDEVTENDGNTRTTFKYTKITRGQSSQSTDNEDENDGSVVSKYEYTTINRGHNKHDDEEEEAENVNGKNYSTLKRNRVSEGSQYNTEEHHFTSTESGNEKKTYTTISRTRGSGSTTENIPYKAIVRNSQGVRLTDEELSGFVKNAGDLAAIEEAKRNYLTISRGGQILQSESNEETDDEHYKTNSMEVMSLTQIEKTTENDEEHNEKEHETDADEENSSKTKFKYQTITRGQTTTTVTEESEDELSSQESGGGIKTRYTTINRGSSKDDHLAIEAESTTTTTTEATTTTTESTTTSTTEEPTTTTEKLVLAESSTEYIAPEITHPTTTTAEPTTRRSLFKSRTTTETNTKETESEVEKSNESTLEVNSKVEEQEVTSTQTGAGRRRVVFRKRPTSQTTINQETVNVKQESKEVSEESNGSSSAQTSFRRRPIAGRRPTTGENESEETKLKFDRGSLTNTETETIEETLETTTRPTHLLPRATYRPKDKGDLSSLLALDLARKYNNNNQQQFGVGKRRRPVIRTHQVSDETEEGSSSRRRTSGSASEEITTNSETINGGSRTTITKKRVFTSKTSGNGDVNSSESVEQTEIKSGTGLKGDTEGLDEESLDAGELNKKQGTKYQFALGSADRKRLGGQGSADSSVEGELSEKSRTTSLNNQQTSSETQTVNGRRRTIIRKRIQTNKSTLSGNASGFGITQTYAGHLDDNSETNLQQDGSNGNELSNSSEKLSAAAVNSLTSNENSSSSSEASGLTSGKSENETTEEENSSANSGSGSKFNFKTRQSATNTYSSVNRKNTFANKHITGSQSDQQETETQSNRYSTLNRKNTFANKRVTGDQSEQNKEGETETESESYETIEEISEEDQNSYNNNISSGSNSQSRNSLSSQANSRRTNYSGQRGSAGSRIPTKPEKYEEVEILEDGSKRIKTIYIETKVVDGKIKTIRRIRTKTIIKQAPEYEYENEDFSTTTTTRRPIPRNRGSARFQSSDLSSLLALDLASKALRRQQGEQSSGKSRRKLIRKPVIVKEEEHVEEFEEELPTRPIRPVTATTEVPEVTSRRTRPTRPLRTTTTTTTTKAPKVEQENTEEGQAVEKVVSTTRRNFAFKRPAGATSRTTTTTTTITKETGEETESANRSKFNFKRPVGTVKTSTTTIEEITKTLVSQSEQQVNGAINRFKTKASRAETTEELSTSTSKPETTTTTTTEKIETTTPETTTEHSVETSTHAELEHDSLDKLKNQFAHAVHNLQTETEKVTETEVIDAVETKNAIQSGLKNGQDLSLPIYHRRKYYQYYKDSPITYINPITIPPTTVVETNVDIAKQIHDVFNVSNDHLDPEPELTDELLAIKAMEQAQEINSELSHFLLKTPGSN